MERPLFDIPDVSRHFVTIVAFCFLTCKIYSFLYDVKHRVHLWWSIGPVCAGIVLGAIHFYDPIYRVNFANSHVGNHFQPEAYAKSVAISAIGGWIIIGGIVSKAVSGALGLPLSWKDVMLSPKLLLQIHVITLTMFLLLKAIELIIQAMGIRRDIMVVGRPDTTLRTLFGGLVDESSFSQEAAVYELFDLVTLESDQKRRLLFTETFGDSMLLREILLFLISYLSKQVDSCQHDVRELKRLEEVIRTDQPWSIHKENPSARDNKNQNDLLYAPSSPSLVNKIIGRMIASPKQKSESSSSSPSKKLQMPPVFKTSDTFAFGENPSRPTHYPKNPIVEYASKLMQSPMGQSLLAVWVNGFQRVKHLPKYQSLECIVKILGAITVASYEEDLHGQVQLLLKDILQSLISLSNTMKALNQPIKGFSQCPESTIVLSIQTAVSDAVKSIINRFTLETLESPAVRLPPSLLADLKTANSE